MGSASGEVLSLLRVRIAERTNAWLGQLHRLLVRHEHLLTTYCAEALFMKHALNSNTAKSTLLSAS
jgi:hypothetical protein